MEPEIFKSKGIEVNTTVGTFFFPDCVVEIGKLFKGKTLTGNKVAKVWDAIADYIEVWDVKEVHSVTKINGWFGRLSAPGYMDSTDWTFARTEEEILDFLSDMYKY
jgi:hypothetical protein